MAPAAARAGARRGRGRAPGVAPPAYCYPNDFTDGLIAAMAETPNVVKYVDMPIQHGASRTLAAMGRRTTREQITDRLDRIRAAMPEVVLRTSFIVGFPGERDEDFAELAASSPAPQALRLGRLLPVQRRRTAPPPRR